MQSKFLNEGDHDNIFVDCLAIEVKGTPQIQILELWHRMSQITECHAIHWPLGTFDVPEYELFQLGSDLFVESNTICVDVVQTEMPKLWKDLVLKMQGLATVAFSHALNQQCMQVGHACCKLQFGSENQCIVEGDVEMLQVSHHFRSPWTLCVKLADQFLELRK